MTITIDYYNNNAEKFTAETKTVDFSANQDKFLSLLPQGALILDFGCGSGRDTLYFLEHEFKVEASDGSEAMCKAASELTGIPVKHMLFHQLDARERYDGIWACASILHLPADELEDVLKKMTAALKPGGVIYTSFKYGDFEGMRNGRYFKNFDENTFTAFMQKAFATANNETCSTDVPSGEAPAAAALKIEELWLSGDVRPGRSGEQWLNVFLRRR